MRHVRADGVLGGAGADSIHSSVAFVVSCMHVMMEWWGWRC